MAKSSREKPISRPLVVPRTTTAALLGGVDVSTIRRLEKAGLLTPIRLNKRSATGQVFYSYAEVVALAEGGHDDPER
jgi:hypothetical protein